MQENTHESPSLIKLGKLANSRDFAKLEDLWDSALTSNEYSWRELQPIAGQVGRQGAVEKADTLMEMLIDRVEEIAGSPEALTAARGAAGHLKKGKILRTLLHRFYLACYPDFDQLPDLLKKLMPEGSTLTETVPLVDLYLELQPGCFAVDRTFLVPGVVESLNGSTGLVTLRFEDRHNDYDPSTVDKLTPRSADHFPALVLYNPDRLVELAEGDPAEFLKLALRSNREDRVNYRELKGYVATLLGENRWKNWWQDAKRPLKRDPLIGMTSGSQPVFRLLRQADRFEDRVRREFDFAKDPQEKLLKVVAYLDEIAREERQGACEDCGDPELLVHLGNGSAKIAVAVLPTTPALALAGLALHAEVAARGVPVARPNPRAAAQVLGRVGDPCEMVDLLPETLLQRVLEYLRKSMPADWGKIWSAILARAGRRLCDSITRGLIEGGEAEALEQALQRAVARPSANPELLGWLWRTRQTSGTAGRFLAGLESLPVPRIVDAMFSLLNSTGKLYGLSMEEKHLKVLESARAAIGTQNMKPLLTLLDDADRREAVRLKGLIEKNAGLSPSQRTVLLGYLRSRYADIFLELTREWEDSSTIYTTEAGLRRTQESLNHIIKEELPAVAKQIGEAASFGDLSENAEFTAALEKRDQLASRATAIESQLALATVITAEMAASDFVNVGTCVTARVGESDQEEIYTFLGPWDTVVEERILNYQAPLPMAFMGAKVGDRVEYGDESNRRSWSILAIEPAI